MPRLILIYNPNSSNYRRVKKDILDNRKKIFAGYHLDEYTIKKIGFENNVKNLTQILRDQDTCLSLGGDATAAITANAIMSFRFIRALLHKKLICTRFGIVKFHWLNGPLYNDTVSNTV